MTRVLAVAAVLAAVSVAGATSANTTFDVHDITRADVTPSASTASPGAPAAWCGSASATDRAPNVVAGNPIHWVYLIPSDGADNLASLAQVMQSDAEQIDAWWRREDSTRVPRNDLASFPCGTQIDITTVRVPLSGAQLTPISGRFAAIANALLAGGFNSTFTKYAVYYDGPTGDEDVCGQGGSNGSGFGLAVTYYRSCVGVSTAAVAAHEFLHTVGAVPSAAPNECEGERAAHTCDTESDIMYPFINNGGLSASLLDPGRNDYYGHGGSWTDTQDSAWLVRLDAQSPLALNVSGTGSIGADVPGLLCTATCTTTWNTGQRLTLTATPGPGLKLVRWSGACSGSSTCTIPAVGAGTTVNALFAPAAFRLNVVVRGQGGVRSSTGGIVCRPRCSATLPSFTPVRLTATPAKGWKLRSWTGACRGAKRICTVPMTAATSARATFVRQ